MDKFEPVEYILNNNAYFGMFIITNYRVKKLEFKGITTFFFFSLFFGQKSTFSMKVFIFNPVSSRFLLCTLTKS